MSIYLSKRHREKPAFSNEKNRISRASLVSISIIVLLITPLLSSNTVVENLGKASLYQTAKQERLAGHFKNSIELFQKCMSSSNNSKEFELDCILNLAILYWNIGDLRLSRRYYNQAANVARDLKLENLQRGASLAIEIHDLYQEGKTLRLAEEYQKSIQSFDRAIALSKGIPSPELELKCLRLQSLTYWELGDFSKYYQLNLAALNLAELLNHNKEKGRCLNNIAAYHSKYDNYSSALSAYEKSLKIAQEENNIGDMADSLLNMGGIWTDLGNYEKSIEYIKRALEIDRNLGAKPNVAKDLNNMGIAIRLKGLAYENAENLEEARDTFLKAMRIARQVGDQILEIQALNNVGSIYADLNQYTDALRYFKLAQEIAKKTGDRSNLGMVFNNIGIIYANLGNLEASTSSYEKAIELASSYKDGTFIWETYFGLGNANTKQANFPEAIRNYKNAISFIEDIRSKIVLEELKASYLGADERLEAYQNLIDLLATLQKTEPEKGYDKEAFNYLERAKARAFLDSLEVAEVDISQGVNPVLANREKELMRDISRAYGKLLAPGFSAEEKEKTSEQIKSSEDQLEALKREIRMSSPAYAELKYPTVITYDEVQRQLMSSGEAYFAYSVGKEKSHAFVVTRKGLKVFDLPARGILHQQVSAYRKAISDNQNRDFRLGRKLFEELVSPGLEPGLKKIIFIPDDILNLLPFETLLARGESNSWLIRDYMISYAPSLSSLRVLRQRHRNGPKPRVDLLAIGDTTYGSGGNGKGTIAGPDILYGLGTSSGISLTPLKYSGLEIQNIARLFNHKKVMILEKENATKRRLRSLPLADYKIIHFAVHSVIDDKKPARSAIVLSFNPDQAEDGLLQTRDIYNLKLDADLVTLSACQTGLGQFIRGEGIEGLSRPFFYAGASSVLMSLWAVNDQATSQLMERFYRHLRGSESLMEALRNAKLELISSGTLSHPYYWAGFIISGKADSKTFPGRRNLVLLLASMVGISLLIVLAAATYRRMKL